MYIGDINYTLNTKTLEIYFNGCRKKMINGKLQHCPGCHNYELWDFKEEDNIEEFLIKIERQFKDFDNLIDKIWILGGEPLDQDRNEMIDFISKLKKFDRPIILFTGYELKYYLEQNFDYDIDFIKTGYYDSKNKNKKFNKTLNCELIGDNQVVYNKDNQEVE